jgi:hypothetical protein
LFNELIAEIKTFCADGEFNDDVSIVGVGIRRLGPLPHDYCSVNAAVI